MKRTALLLIAALLCATPISVRAQSATFADVSGEHWAFDDIHTLRELGVTNGVGNNLFGLGRSLTRAEFVTFLAPLLNWKTGGAGNNPWYTPFVTAAVERGAVPPEESKNFRPNDAITREEMAVLLVRSLGYNELAQQLGALPAPFDDAKNNAGYITIAKDLGVIVGMTPGNFAPNATATREQAAAMMVRLRRILDAAENTDRYVNGFYAIRSAGQSDFIAKLDSVSYGWCRLEPKDGGVTLNITNEGGNVFYRPDGYQEALNHAKGKKKLLMIPVEGDPQVVISNKNVRDASVALIALAAAAYDGVVIDFENLKGAQAKTDFTAFLTALKTSPAMQGKTLSVAVQPVRVPGQAYFDGYDYKAIGEIADQVILMAHDYEPKRLTDEEMAANLTVTPLSPIHEVYRALQAITDPNTGVADKNKILLQFSCATAQWKSADGHIINRTPFTPGYDAIQTRIAQGAAARYSTKYENPYLTFISEEDGAENIVWYENQRSVLAKMRLAALFGIQGVSLWRLGLIPDDITSIFS